MYPLTCVAGFNVPARQGKFEIIGFCVTVDDVTADAEFAIVDDETIDPNGKAGKIISSLGSPTEVKNVLAHKKYATNNSEPVMEWFPSCAIKTRYGTSLYFDNIKQGSVCVYVR